MTGRTGGFRRWLLPAMLGLAAYLISLVILLPASFVWERIGARGLVPPGVAVQGVSGTVWSGAASRAGLPGPVTLSDATWRFDPGALLSGRLGWTLKATLAGGPVEGRVAFGPGSLRVSDARADLPASPLVTPFMRFPAVIEGRLLLDVQRLILDRDGRVRDAEGVLGWLDAGAGLPEAVPLGDLRAQVAATQDGALRLDVGDQGGPLVAQGVVEMAVDGRYRVEGAAGTREGADPRLGQALRMMGAPDRDGRVPIRLSGSFRN